MIARSRPVSETLNPPAKLRNTSLVNIFMPTRFSNTASNMLMRRGSYPVAVRCGVPYAALPTRACTSIR